MPTHDSKDLQASPFFQRIPLTSMPDGTRVIEDVSYGSHPQQRIDVYLPKTTRPAPALIEFHGGGWRYGDKRQLGLYKGIIEGALELGVAVVAANYRLTPESPWPAQSEDAVRVVQFTRHKAAEWGIDPARIVLIGGSAGAHLSVWVASHEELANPESADPVKRESSRVSGVIDCWGPMDLTRAGLEGKAKAIYTQLFGCTEEDWDSPRVRTLRADATPLNLVGPDAPPMLLIHDHPERPLPEAPDWVLSDGHSSIWGALLKARLEQAGVPVQALFGATPAQWNPACANFLRERLGL